MIYHSSKESAKMKIKLAYGRIEKHETKTAEKVFLVPYFDEWKESILTFDVTLEERALLDAFLYDFNRYAHPMQIVWKMDEHQGYQSLTGKCED